MTESRVQWLTPLGHAALSCFTSIMLLLAALVPFAHAAEGQSLPAYQTSLGDGVVIEAAEGQGRAFPRVMPPDSSHIPFRMWRWVGSEGRVCVEVGTEATRSGDFVITGRLDAPFTDDAPASSRHILWRPLRFVPRSTISIVGRRLAEPSDSVRVSSSQVGFPVRDGRLPEAERQWFYVSDVVVPRAGRWLFVASDASNWGCFIITIT